MLLNLFQWELYRNSIGQDTIKQFEKMISGDFDGYCALIDSLIRKYCPSEAVVQYIAGEVSEAVKALQEVIADQIPKCNISQFKDIYNLTEGEGQGENFARKTWEGLWDDYLRALEDRGTVYGFYSALENLVFDSTVNAFLHPEFFIPYYYIACFNVLQFADDMFKFHLPTLPSKKQYKERYMYYLDICIKLQKFRVINALTVPELYAFLYEYAPMCVGGTSWIWDTLPQPRNAYVFGIGPDSGLLDTNENEIVCWQGNPQMQPGDLGMLYEWSPASCFSSVWQAVSPGFRDPLFMHERCVYYGRPKKIPRVTYKMLKNDYLFSKTPLIRTRMMGMDGTPLSAAEYNHLLSMAESIAPLSDDIPKLEAISLYLDECEILDERDVEMKLLEPLLNRLGWAHEDYVRQMSLRMGRGFNVYPDYVIRPVHTPGYEKGDIIVEAKRTISNQKTLEVDRAQARSYARRLNSYALRNR